MGCLPDTGGERLSEAGEISGGCVMRRGFPKIGGVES